MFEVYDIVNIGTILIIFFFLFILIQIERYFTKPGIFLRTALFILLIMLMIEELISQGLFVIPSLIYPLHIALYFTYYPLIYIYSRALVYLGEDKNRSHTVYFLIVPIIVLVYMIVIFYPLDYASKVKFMTLHLSESSPNLPGYSFYQYSILILYYIQMFYFLVATLRLKSAVTNKPLLLQKIDGINPWQLLIVKYLYAYVAAVIVFEALLASCSIVFVDKVEVIKASEMLLTLLFISFGLYIAFKQSLIIIQSRIYKYSSKLEVLPRGYSDGDQNVPNTKESNSGVTVQQHKPAGEQLSNKILLSENEKQEIKDAVEDYFTDSKIYLDPNLKLEQLSRKIHINARKISIVINEVFGTNFNQFINEYRISEVKKLISRNPDDIVIENIYTKVGFNSRSSFNRVFKESTGVSPTEYISQLQSETTLEV